MARLPEIRKINPSDFPQQSSFMPRLLSPINSFFENVIRALNRNLTFKENLNADILTATVDGTFPIKMKWSLPSTPTAAWIGKCFETSGNHTNFSNPLFLDWQMNTAGEFQINNITGLSASSTNRYYVTIVAITG